ncbi:MAG: hypothetical protein DRO09_02100 [Thermoprotei archaeon]|nr:MAG: hypothetical protein DRO09_02100 [Thermoprotei archaeon]
MASSLLAMGGLAILLHQYLLCHELFNPNQFLHHENLAIALFCLAIGYILPKSPKIQVESIKIVPVESVALVFSFLWGGLILNYLDNYPPWWRIPFKDEYLIILYFAPFLLTLNPYVIAGGGLLSSFWQDLLWGCLNHYGCLGWWSSHYSPLGYKEFWTLSLPHLGLNLKVTNQLYFLSLIRLPLGLFLLYLSLRNRGLEPCEEN